MKLAISCCGSTLDAAFDPRFGRAASFCLVDSVTGAWTAHANPALAATGGAGVQAAQFVAGLGAQAVISGAYGPKAHAALSAAGITMYVAPDAAAPRAAEVLARFQAGTLAQAAGPSHDGRHGG